MKKILLTGSLLLGLPGVAWANCNATANAPALTPGTQPCSMDLSGNLRVSGGGSGGSTGSVTAAGTNGTLAQAVQGINSGVPVGIQGGTANTVVSSTNPLPITIVSTSGNSAVSARASGSDGLAAVVGVAGYYTAAPAEATVTGAVMPKTDIYGALYSDVEGIKPTYSATASVTMAATPTDVVQICGAASKVIRIRQISLQGVSTVTGGDYPILLVKRSAANTVGTSSAVTQVPLDSGSGASGATVLAYTANPTITGVIGTVAEAIVQFPLITAAVNPTLVNFGTASNNGQSVVLRTAAECLGINLAGVTLTGTVTTLVVGLQYTIE